MMQPITPCPYMMTMPLLNSDLDTFKNAFEAGLSRMLAPDALGAFILVLANSMQDQRLADGLAADLKETFATLSEKQANGTLSGGADDVTVFERLLPTGIENYRAWETRSLGPWQCAYNPLRALKPERASNVPFDTLQLPFNEEAFHFDKPFLKSEILSEESLDGTTLRIMYQKFPFVPYHLLILLDAAAHHAQYLSQPHHALVGAMVEKVSEKLPGFGLAYNSIGAGASVNHLHTHGFIQDQLPIELTEWQHNGGSQPYPVTCQPFANLNACWDQIKALHQSEQPYNLLYRKDRTYLLTRPPQSTLKTPAWLSNVTWFEASGAFNLIDQHTFNQLTASDIKHGLSGLTEGHLGNT